MAHTNSTANYNLTQFVGTDIPNPLTDYNGDMETIDTTMHNIAESVTDNVDSISALDTRLTTAEGDIDAVETRATNLESSMSTAESDIDTLQTTLTTAVGNISTLTTKVGTAEDDIDALETRMTTAESDIDAVETRATNLESSMSIAQSDIDALETQNGSTTLTTDAQTLSGAVNELDSYLSSNWILTGTDSVSVTGDGSETVGNLILRATTLYSNYVNSLDNDTMINLHSLNVFGGYNGLHLIPVAPSYKLQTSGFVDAGNFIGVSNTAGDVQEIIRLRTYSTLTYCILSRVVANSSGVTYANLSNDTAVTSLTITINFNVYKHI